MKKVPLHWFIADVWYYIVGTIGTIIKSTHLIDMQISHIDKRLKQAEKLSGDG